MTIFCGIYALDTKQPYPVQWQRHLEANLSRNGEGEVLQYRDDRLFLLKLALHAYPDPGWKCDERGITTACGDTLLASRSDTEHRGRDMEALHGLAAEELPRALRGARGSFCLVKYARESGRLAIASDRLGVRPVYWMRAGGAIVFAGALRLLESLPGLELSLDLRGAMETAVFGQQFAERTAYAQISSLHGGRILDIAPSGHALSTYWRWDTDACTEVLPDDDALLDDLKREFTQAVARRLGSARAAFASLSGGLDSRCVVTALASTGARVHTINASWPGSLDLHVGRTYAEALGTTHYEVLLPTGTSVNYLRSIRPVMDAHAHEVREGGGFPRQVWGGNDGSISVGHVYNSKACVAALRSSGAAVAAETYLRESSLELGTALFRRDLVEELRRIPAQSVVDELSGLQCKDPGQGIYIFLTKNRQRRMAACHYEDIDVDCVEPIEPFIDGDFLSFACKLPVDACLSHALYHRWLGKFSKPIASVPWQVYPGHEPCPLPMPPGVLSQWEIIQTSTAKTRSAADRKAARALLRQLLGNREMFAPLFSLPRLTGLGVALGAGLNYGSYLLEQLRAITPFLARCSGRISGL
jgi:asparagine synthase (glutamine-hydrolysing)